MHDEPEMYEEVYDVERQPIEGVKETEVKEHLKKKPRCVSVFEHV